MRSRARARLSGAFALLAASGLGGTWVLAQTTAGAPPGTVLPASQQNGGTAPSTSTAATSGNLPPGTVLPRSEQNAGASQAPNPAPTAGSTPPSGEQSAGAPPAGGGAPAIGVEEVRAFVGKDVLTPSGNVLGTLDNVTTNSAGQPEKVVISRGGFLGLFQSQYMADWNVAKPKIENGKLVFALTPQDLSKQTANK